MSQLTRREFFENSMLTAAAATAAGSAMSSERLAAEGSRSANDRLRVAVLGIRGRGRVHLGEYLKRKDCDVVAVVDPDEVVGQTKGVERVEQESGRKPAFYTDMRKVMDDKSIDIVSIATPNHWHALASIWAIQSGKDVYVEKPVSHNVSEGRRMVQAARKYGKIVQTGTQCRSMQGTIDAIEYVKSGRIGEVKLARGFCYKKRDSIGPRGKYDIPPSVDYGLWLGPAPEKPLSRSRFHYDWHWIWDTGNGDLGNQGIHQMDICRWGLGVDDLGQSVTSYGGRLGYTDAGETANTQVSIHDFGDKRLVFEVRGLIKKPRRVGVIFYGSEGYVELTEYTGGAAYDSDGQLVKSFKGGGDHFGNFLSAVRSRKVEDLHADILEGHLSSALCHLGNISYRLGERITTSEAKSRLAQSTESLETFQKVVNHLGDNNIDLEKTKLKFGRQLTVDGQSEVFTDEGTAEANAMLTRDYRKPFVVPSAREV